MLPLGMENGIIKDHQVNQSSFFGVYAGYNARLNHDSHWRPLDDDTTPWIRIDLVKLHRITGIITQGRIGDGMKKRWVKNFYVQYSKGGNQTRKFVHVQDDVGNNKVM